MKIYEKRTGWEWYLTKRWRFVHKRWVTWIGPVMVVKFKPAPTRVK